MPQPVLHPFGTTPEGYVDFAMRLGVDVLPQPVHWGGKEAEQKLAQDIAEYERGKAEALAKAEAEAERAKTEEDFAFGY